MNNANLRQAAMNQTVMNNATVSVRDSLRFKFPNQFIKKHPYFWCSIAIHVVLLFIISHMAFKPVVASSAPQQVRLSMHNAYRMSMQESVKNMAKLERDLVNTLDESAKKNVSLEPIEESFIGNTKTTPSQLLELAKKISENIRKIERELRAIDLERAVTMSHNDALKTVMSLEIGIPEYRANKMPGEEMVRSVEKLEVNAKNSLQIRKDDMEKRGIGDPSSQNKESDTAFDSTGKGGNKDSITGLKNLNYTVTDHQTTHTKNDFVDVWLDHIPPVKQDNPKKIAGRILKNGAQCADRIFINSWYVIGPFPISVNKAPPDYAIDLEALYYGKDNQIVRWQYLSNASYPLTPPQSDKSGVFFGYTEIMVDHEQDLWVWVGADDFATLRLNENIIWDSNVYNEKFNKLARDKNNLELGKWNLTEYKRLVHFNAGRNTFKFKLTNSDASTFFSLVLTK
jgi:hypothetical protein